ncbi:hypothetical protein R1flu_011577 [Riccia fluitans]|uniref:Fungal lipase-type domain-containing protein n=1 Tax=Riccia fluitans TaxID=41844 RepID=A0ABD1Z8F1_9MARC
MTGHVEPKASIAERWKLLQGSNDWNGLLSPLDLDLRREILRYGDFAQVTEDAFPWVQKSPYPYACPHKKWEMLQAVGQPDTGYEVTRYLYSYLRGMKSEVQEVNWIGYVAVTVDPEEIKRLGRRDIIVAWRGTRTNVEWQQDARFIRIPITSINGKPTPKNVEVAEGFWMAFADEDPAKPFLGKGSAGKQATAEVKRLVEKYAGEELSITCLGHSLGGTLATFCAYQIAEDGINRTASGATIPVTAFTYASPRVGNTVFRDRVKELGVKVLRIRSKQDIVPCFPVGLDRENTPILDTVKALVRQMMKLSLIEDVFGFFVEKLEEAVKFDGYAHVGTTLTLNFTKSPYLKQPSKPVDLDSVEVIGNHHNLQGYLHLVNGIAGTDNDLNKKFSPVILRDLALINKSADILVDSYAVEVPGIWWKLQHNGMVRARNNSWKFPFLFDPTSPESHPDVQAWN